MKPKRLLIVIILITVCIGCTGTSKPVRRLTKPVDETAGELVKVRELKSEEGETRAVLSPADAEEGQLKIKF